MIVGIIDQKSVIDGFLQALGFVALWYEGTGASRCGTFFNTSGLSQSFVMSLDVVNNDSPFSVSVDGSQWLDVGGFGWAQVGFLNNFLQSIDRVIGVGQNVFVHLLNGIVVVFNSLLDFVGGVFRIFKTPGFWVVYGTLWWRGIVVGSWCGMVRGGMVGSGVVWGSSVVDSVVGGGVSGVRCRCVGIMVRGRGGGIRIMVRGGAVVGGHWGVTVWCRGGGVTISSVVVNDGVWGGSRGRGDQCGNDHQFHLRVYKI